MRLKHNEYDIHSITKYVSRHLMDPQMKSENPIKLGYSDFRSTKGQRITSGFYQITIFMDLSSKYLGLALNIIFIFTFI